MRYSQTAFVSSFTPTTLSSSWTSSTTSLRPSHSLPSPYITNAPNTTAPTMGFFNLSFLFQGRDVVSIPPQDAVRRFTRQKSLTEARESYQWNQNIIKGASLMDGLPHAEAPSLGWIEVLMSVLLRVGINTAINAAEDSAEDEDKDAGILEKLTIAVGLLGAAITTGTFNPDKVSEAINIVGDLAVSKAHVHGGTLREHKELFENIKLDVVAKNDQFLRDDIFGWYRVAGPNPMKMIQHTGAVADLFPELTNDIVRGIEGFADDCLEDMHRENRLYSVSYPEFEGVPTGNTLEGVKKPSFIYSPTCLLAVPKNPTARQTVLPIAIRCGQNMADLPMYTANEKHTKYVTWLAAKLTVQVADAVSHEAVYHLARTHLVVGIIVCSTHRALPNQHPLYRLLKCHFYGTAFINYAATTALINPGGIIDQITAPDIFTTRAVSANGVNGSESMFNDWFPDVDLKKRGVMDPVLKYPYRDDALQVWDATLNWVRDYITAYYKSDSDVRGDSELKAWCAEITDADKGNLHGFGDNSDGEILTVDYLVRAVALMVFTATAQHAAVNFSQGTMMQFAPAMPLGGYAPTPKTAEPFSSVDDLFLHMMPPLDSSEQQLTTAELIGVLQFTALGEYGRSLSFAPEEVLDAMQTFQSRLGVIGGKIQERNTEEQKAGLPVYKHLVPSNIPMSINV